MNTTQSLLIYLIICLFLFSILIRIRMQVLSAIVFTLLVGQILLNIIHNPANITPWSPNGESITSSTAIYILIQIATPIIALIYIFIKCWHDRVPIEQIKKCN